MSIEVDKNISFRSHSQETPTVDYILPDYLSEIREQGENPPGNDQCIAAFYQALSELEQEDRRIGGFIEGITARRELTPQYFTNLVFRSFQYTKLYLDNNDDYPSGYEQKDQWAREIPELLDKHGSLISELLLTKDTKTTVYERYASTKAVLNSIFPNQSLAVADFGCGSNYGLPGLSKQIPFSEINDHTPQQLVNQLLSRPLTIEQGLAIDKEDPQDPDTVAWTLANYYPKELAQAANRRVLEAEIRGVENVAFLQADLRNLQVNHENGTLPSEYFDAVVMNTLCYQMPYEEQQDVFERARKSLTPEGIIIVQDFAKKSDVNPQQLDFGTSWFSEPYSYRTFIAGERTNWDMSEVLQWKNGRCNEVRPGEDFEVLAPDFR